MYKKKVVPIVMFHHFLCLLMTIGFQFTTSQHVVVNSIHRVLKTLKIEVLLHYSVVKISWKTGPLQPVGVGIFGLLLVFLYFY